MDGRHDVRVLYEQMNPITWHKTSDRLPTTEIGGQVDVLMWSPGWGTWLKGVFTFWPEKSEWLRYDQQIKRYHGEQEAPEYWCAPVVDEETML